MEARPLGVLDVGLNDAILALYPTAIPGIDYTLRDEGQGVYIATWNDSKLGPKPTADQLQHGYFLAAKNVKKSEFALRCFSDIKGAYPAEFDQVPGAWCAEAMIRINSGDTAERSRIAGIVAKRNRAYAAVDAVTEAQGSAAIDALTWEAM